MTSYHADTALFQPARRPAKRSPLAWIRAAMAAQVLARRYRRDLGDLRRLDPALLRDMGLTLRDIDQVTPGRLGLHRDLMASPLGEAAGDQGLAD